MNISLFKNSILWGFTLWLIGYLLGIFLFFVVPIYLIGWVITPIGIALTIWVLLRKVFRDSLVSYFLVGIFWTLIAVIMDYIFLVQLLQPEDGYYKPDVYLYYLFTLLLPLLVGWFKLKNESKS